MLTSIGNKMRLALNLIGIDVVKSGRVMCGLPQFIRDYRSLKAQMDDGVFSLRLYPILDDRFKQGGTASGHYFHQDLYVAKKVYDAEPIRHVDIGSRVDGFIAHLAVFRKVVVLDVRQTTTKVANIEFVQADMMDLESELYESCDSLSSLHALEHFGLGRYGDPIDVDGHLKGFENMYKLLKANGTLYFSVPMGTLRIEFNAHRVFSLDYLLSMFKERFVVKDFAYIDDMGDLHESVTLTDIRIKENCACHYGCAIFELQKIGPDVK